MNDVLTKFRSHQTMWKEAPLVELAEVVSGVAKGRKLAGDVQEIPYLRVANVQDGFLDLREIKTIPAIAAELDRYRLLPGDVVLTEGGDHDKLGRGALWRDEIQDCIHQNHIFRVRIDRARLQPEFFVYYLRSSRAKTYFLKCAKKTTNLASINMSQLKTLPVPLPPLEHQSNIANILSILETVLQKRREAIELIPTLVEARFLELFGHPSSNEKGFLEMPLERVALIARGRFSPRPRNDPQYYGGQYPFIQTGDVVRSGLYVTQHTQTLNEKGLKVSKQFPAGTIAITIAANIGETAILTYDTCFPDSVVGLQCVSQHILPEFLRFQLQLLKEHLQARATQTAQKNINVETLKSLTVMVPPIELQRQFAHEVSCLGDTADNMTTQQFHLATMFEVLRDLLFSANSASVPELAGYV